MGELSGPFCEAALLQQQGGRLLGIASRPVAANKAQAKRHLMCINVPAPSPALSAGSSRCSACLIVLMTAYKLYQLVL
jgi:hypothetical protein